MKAAVILLYFVLFNLIAAQAQEKKIDLEFSLFPNYSAGILSIDDMTSASFEPGLERIERWKPALSGTFCVAYRLTDKSIIGLGIGYQNNGSRTEKIDVFSVYDPITGNVISDPSAPTQVRFVNNHYNVEIPLYFKRTIGKKFYAIVGTSAILNVLNRTSAIQYFSDGSKIKITEKDNSTDFRGFNFSVNVGFGLDCLTKEKRSLFVHPYAQYGVLDVSKSASINRNYLSVGISTGIRI